MVKKSELAYGVIQQVRPLYKRLLRAVERNLEGTGISVPLRGLLEVLSTEGPRTAAQLARRLLLARQFTLRLSNEALELGLVAAHPNPEHRRSMKLALTPEGERLLLGVRAREQAVITRVARSMERADIEACLRTLQKLEAAFAEWESQ